MAVMCFGAFFGMFLMRVGMFLCVSGVCSFGMLLMRFGVFLVCFWYVVGTFLVRLVWFGVFFYMFLMHFGMWLMCF